ncbi:flagellar protein export ATPase FliI [Rickettsiales bacterium]|nr:flagellar protein export ATPase FliI [Rickettsiales bacterium]
MIKQKFDHLTKEIDKLSDFRFFGRVTAIKGLSVECSGIEKLASVGSKCRIVSRDNRDVDVEVVGFDENKTLLMPFSSIDGVGIGCKVWLIEESANIYPSSQWRGRVINAMAQPIDDKGFLPKGDAGYPLKSSPLLSHDRKRVEGKFDLGVKALNTFVTCCKGQRLGVFSGSGVGKSVLISMMTKYCEADIKVIGLIGERGREVQEFLQDYLGEEGLKNAVVIVATGDESALMRRQAAYLTLAISEYFRDQGEEVLCLMDSVTRFAMAQREIGLAAGEPPTTKGYTPTVFSELPKLLERAGPGGREQGSITGIFSVLVEGDDHNEPISDAVRGILDGHIILDRSIAERGRFPAINVLKSISRTMPGCNSEDENMLVTRAKQLMSTYSDMEELIRLGAYRNGSDPKVDEAIYYNDALEKFLSQLPTEISNLASGYEELRNIFGQQPAPDEVSEGE